MTYSFKPVHFTLVVKKFIQVGNYKGNKKSGRKQMQKKEQWFQTLNSWHKKRLLVTAKYRIGTKTSNSCSLCSHQWSHKHNSLAGASQYTQQDLAGTKNMLPKGCARALSASSASLWDVLSEPQGGTLSQSLWQCWMLDSILFQQNERAGKSVSLVLNR